MLLKKAGMVVIGAAAGVAALSGTAFAGDWPGDSGGHHQGWDRDHDKGHDHSHGGNGNATAKGGDCANFGSQGLLGINCTNIQAPINQLGVLSAYDNSSDGHDGHRHGGRDGDGRTGGDHGGHGDSRDGDDDGGNGNATARGGDQANFGDQGLIGINNTNIQAPINQLGLLSAYNNAS